MASGRLCSFSEAWLSTPSFASWLLRDNSSVHRAKCRVCVKSFDVGNMGEAALKSHAKGAKHQTALKKFEENALSSLKITELFSPKAPSGRKDSSGVSRPDVSSDSVASKPSTTPMFATNSEVLTSEVWWTLKMMRSHYSCKSSDDISFFLQKMCPDSNIMTQFTCGEKKAMYLAVFGIAPYYSQLLKSNFKDCDYVLLFDESMNKKSQRKQMDFHIRFWQHDEVVNRYMTSEFMGHCRADDMVEKFEAATEDLPRQGLLQLSMDGPNVNWSFYDQVNKAMEKNVEHSLLNVGSCGLHVVHGAFKTGAEKSELGVQALLTALHYLFYYSPARREDYMTVTGSNVFPQKFCKTRWVENASAANRAILIWPQICEYVAAVDKKTLPNPGTTSFKTVEAATKDPLTLTKLSFFESVALQVTPFLKLYQTDKPMMPFLIADLRTLIKSLLDRFAKTAELTPKKLAFFDPKDKTNWKELSSLDLGIKAERALKQAKQSSRCTEKSVLGLRLACRTFLVELVGKLLTKSPIRYSLGRSMACLDPRELGSKNCQVLFKTMVRTMAECKVITDELADEACRQYSAICDSLGKVEFDPHNDRLDKFWFNKVSGQQEYARLWVVLRKALILSHGQASVERGFSVNRNIEADNMSEKTLVARRIICDHIKAVGYQNLSVDKKLLLSAASARQKYMAYLEEEKRAKAQASTQTLKRNLEDEVDVVRKRKRQIEIDVNKLLRSADTLAKQAEDRGSLTMLSKSNSLRRTAQEKQELLKGVSKELEDKLLLIKNNYRLMFKTICPGNVLEFHLT